jgi:hypothetical protein
MRYRLGIVVGLVLAFVGTVSGIGVAGPVSDRMPTPPTVQKGYYDDHLDAFVSTDTSSKAQAKAMGINYSPSLASLNPRLFPEVYMVDATAADGQLTVFGSEPGESTYSPIWREVTVTWTAGVTPVVLTSDTQIEDRAAMGDLTVTRTKILLNRPLIAVDVAADATVTPPTVFMTFYDGHRDGMLATDVSTKPQAKAEGINYSPVLASLDPLGFPEIYIVRGTMADGQLQILGSEPGESSYSPLWLETIVRWNKGVTPSLIKSDTRIDHLIEAGKVTERGTTVLLNCPVISTPETTA